MYERIGFVIFYLLNKQLSMVNKFITPSPYVVVVQEQTSYLIRSQIFSFSVKLTAANQHIILKTCTYRSFLMAVIDQTRKDII
jgi:hypothetical protein